MVTRKGQSIKMVIEPIRIAIGHLAWVLPTGTYEVPKSVAARYRDMIAGQSERQARSDLLEADKIKDEESVRKDWQDISTKTGTRADPFPVSGGY
jgi:hypothetical protein